MTRLNLSDILGVLCLMFALCGGNSEPVSFLLVMVPMACLFGVVRLTERGSLL